MRWVIYLCDARMSVVDSMDPPLRQWASEAGALCWCWPAMLWLEKVRFYRHRFIRSASSGLDVGKLVCACASTFWDIGTCLHTDLHTPWVVLKLLTGLWGWGGQALKCNYWYCIMDISPEVCHDSLAFGVCENIAADSQTKVAVPPPLHPPSLSLYFPVWWKLINNLIASRGTISNKEVTIVLTAALIWSVVRKVCKPLWRMMCADVSMFDSQKVYFQE